MSSLSCESSLLLILSFASLECLVSVVCVDMPPPVDVDTASKLVVSSSSLLSYVKTNFKRINFLKLTQ